MITLWDSNQKFKYKNYEPDFIFPMDISHLIHSQTFLPADNIKDLDFKKILSQFPNIDIPSFITSIQESINYSTDTSNLKIDTLSKIQYQLDCKNYNRYKQLYQDQYYSHLVKALQQYIQVCISNDIVNDIEFNYKVTDEEYIDVCSSIDTYRILITNFDFFNLKDLIPIEALIISTKHWYKLLSITDFENLNEIMFFTIERLTTNIDDDFISNLFNEKFLKRYIKIFLKNKKHKSSIELYTKPSIFKFASSNKLIMDKLANVFESTALLERSN